MWRREAYKISGYDIESPEAPIQINDEYVRKYLWDHNLAAINEGELEDVIKQLKLLKEAIGNLTLLKGETNE